MRDMTHRNPLLRRALLGTLAAALLISCSTGGTKDATKISKADLRKALPNAADIGNGYRLDKSKDEDNNDDGSDAAFDKACPEIKKLGLDSNSGDDKDEVKVKFLTDDGRSVETAYDTSPDNFEVDQLDTVVAAINKCDTVRYTADDGTKVEVDLSAKRDDSHGDAGVRFKLQARGDVAKVSFTVDSEGLIFSVDGLGAQVVAQGSVDENDFSSIDPDTDKIDDLADIMVDNVRSAE